ncbi:MAG: hypothetical protein ABII01_04155 [Candidatus Woesearchaeota archaeon]
MSEDNQIILYEGSPLERIASSDIVLRTDKPLMEQKRLFLASDVVVGEYGVTGFVVVDNKPEKRWISYTEGDKTGVSWDPEYHSLEFTMYGLDEPLRKAHFANTDEGFKMIRYFILPSNVSQFFRTDKFLGYPMIDKCCREGTLPEEFDEVEVNPVYAFHGEEREIIDRIIERISPNLQQIGESRFSWEDFGHQVYFSFHPWQTYKPVLEAGEESVVRAVRNFDQFLSRFDERKKLQRRDLEIQGAQEYKGVLPPSE